MIIILLAHLFDEMWILRGMLHADTTHVHHIKPATCMLPPLLLLLQQPSGACADVGMLCSLCSC
jgi:hypothetical protein